MHLRCALSQKGVLLNNNNKSYVHEKGNQGAYNRRRGIEKLAKHNNHVQVNNKHI